MDDDFICSKCFEKEKYSSVQDWFSILFLEDDNEDEKGGEHNIL